MPLRNMQKRFHSAFQSVRVVGIDYAAQKYAQRVESNCAPAQFLVYLSGIECAVTPHFNLVDGCCGDVVATHEPRLAGVPPRLSLHSSDLPVFRFGFVPASADRV